MTYLDRSTHKLPERSTHELPDRSTHDLPDRESKNLPDSHLYPHSCKDSCQEKQCLCTLEAVVQGYMVEPKNNKNIN